MAKEKIKPLFSDDKIAAKRFQMIMVLGETLAETKDHIVEFAALVGRPRAHYVPILRDFDQWYGEFKAFILAGQKDDFIVRVLQKEAKNAQGKDD